MIVSGTYVRRLGPTDGVPLVAIHGGPDWDHSYLLPGLRPVAAHRPVLAYDLRGCGRSDRPGSYQPELLVGDLARLLDALGHRQVDLLGFSTGGQVAQLFVAAHPDRVRRLVLASTTAYPDPGEYADVAELARRRALDVPRPAWVEGPTAEWAVRDAPLAIWDLDRLTDYLVLLRGVRFSTEWYVPFTEGRLHPWRPPDPPRVLRDFGRPVLILHGEHDMGFPVQVARRLQAEVPHARSEVLARAGHMAHVDRPDAWAAAVLDFLLPAPGGLETSGGGRAGPR